MSSGGYAVKPGETFKPGSLRAATNGKVYPPAIVDRQKGVNDLGDGEKRLYRNLYNRALVNSDGICWPGFITLAADLGKCEKTVRTEAANLESLKLIRRDRSNRRAATVYQFLWHAMFEQQKVPRDDRQHVTAQAEPECKVERQIQDSCAVNSRQLCGKQLPRSISVISKNVSKTQTQKLTTASLSAKAAENDAGSKAALNLAELAQIGNHLAGFMDDEQPPKPLLEFVLSLAAQYRLSAADILGALTAAWQRGAAPGQRNAPRQWKWFHEVLRNAFVPGYAARLPEPPSAGADVCHVGPMAGLTRAEQAVQEEFNRRATEASAA
jgi:hypothetical protein